MLRVVERSACHLAAGERNMEVLRLARANGCPEFSNDSDSSSARSGELSRDDDDDEYSKLQTG